MALRFIDSFAHWSYNAGTGAIFSKWTNVFEGAWSGSGGRRNAPFFSGPATLLKTLTHQNRYIMGAAIQHNALRGKSMNLSNNGFPMMTLNMNSDSTLSVLAGSVNIGHSSIAVPDPTSWHYYEVDSTFGVTGTASTVTLTASVRVDGQSYGLFSGTSNVNTPSLIDGSATANQVGFTLDTNSVMDFYCVDTNGTDQQGNATINTSFLSDCEIDAIFPGTDASVGGPWGTVGGDGTHVYSCVNDNPPDNDTSYVHTTATGTVESFVYTPIGAFTGAILGAQYLVYARKDAENARAIAMTLGTNTLTSIEYLGTNQFLSDYYVYYIAELDTNFGTPWTPTVFSTSTFGFVLSS